MLLLNDQSLHGQYADVLSFSLALHTILQLAAFAKSKKMEVHVSPSLYNCEVMDKQVLLNCMHPLERNLRSSLIRFLDKNPKWDRHEDHKDEVWIECFSDLIQGTVLAEAAIRRLSNQDTAILSFDPSIYSEEVLDVAIGDMDSQARTLLKIMSITKLSQLEAWLTAIVKPIGQWAELRDWTAENCKGIRLAPTALDRLGSHPFSGGSCSRLQDLLLVLNELAQSREAETGKLSAKGMEIKQKHFVGEKAWFSDSSETEKRMFKDELTFPHPSNPGEYIFAPWHGKVKIGQLRIHYDDNLGLPEHPLDVVYIGPKITKT